ncbi:probable LRR receptor-like serine/threonine-protein kinase At1g67720 [Oryza brachyantha]|uniref:probable LRR receptor-like serine/threonine-protein kinase At1g67720 n=1 Tax=Oryza brachyantha TaxID=4533 RepID=UPI0003EAA221|nr:probable LRR receptor-like serine/threonine-protein kinase At1g67720 [Oryza brachyantha]
MQKSQLSSRQRANDYLVVVAHLHLPMIPFSLLAVVLVCGIAGADGLAGCQISCGATSEKVVGDVTWVPDAGRFVGVGNATDLKSPGVLPVLSSLRYFPDTSARKYCYVVPAERKRKYLVRTTYFYGGFDGGGAPPVFDQIIDGTRWSEVDTAGDYARGLATYYEAVVLAAGKEVSVCLARNAATKSSPFISALEVSPLEDSVYNSTDFESYALSTIARHSFGHDGSAAVSYPPGDRLNRFWEAHSDGMPVVESQASVSPAAFWNKPPEEVFRRGVTAAGRGESLELQWPPAPLPAASYYLALYFQDSRAPGPLSWRVFDVAVNGQTFFAGLNVSTAGSMLYGDRWPLSGRTKITLTPAPGSPVGPVINAAELMMVVPLGGRTHPRDVIGMEALARGFDSTPPDWAGDPCLPQGNSWTGVTCTQGPLARVVALNLTNFSVGGSISDGIANLTAVSSIWLVGNNLTGAIPDMSLLHHLVSLHLENNRLTGVIPPSLGNLPRLRELFVQNNTLQGMIPSNLKNRTDIMFQYAPGNNLS